MWREGPRQEGAGSPGRRGLLGAVGPHPVQTQEVGESEPLAQDGVRSWGQFKARPAGHPTLSVPSDGTCFMALWPPVSFSHGDTHETWGS